MLPHHCRDAGGQARTSERTAQRGSSKRSRVDTVEDVEAIRQAMPEIASGYVVWQVAFKELIKTIRSRHDKVDQRNGSDFSQLADGPLLAATVFAHGPAALRVHVPAWLGEDGWPWIAGWVARRGGGI